MNVKKLITASRIIAGLTGVGLVTILMLLGNAVSVSIFGYSDLLYLATKWQVAITVLLMVPVTMIVCDKILFNEICKAANKLCDSEEES